VIIQITDAFLKRLDDAMQARDVKKRKTSGPMRLRHAHLPLLALFCNSCATATLFTLPEPRNRKEKLRNDLAPLAIPAALAVDVVATPILAGYAVAKGFADVDRMACEDFRRRAERPKDPDQ
jgi:hypothetical protein